MRKILVIGSANADFLIHAERVPKLGETITGYDFQINAGGKGLNQAVAVKKLGGNVEFCGCVGQDSHGDLLLDALKKVDIPFAGFRTDQNSTGLAIVTVVDGDNFIILNPGANGNITPAWAEKRTDLIRQADYILLQLEIPLETVVRIAEIARDSNAKIILNPAPCQPLPDSLYPLIDILIPNEHEAEQLTGISAADEKGCENALLFLRKKGVETVIITLGGRGCVFCDGNTIRFIPAVKTRVVDTTSAGDTFIGAICCRLAAGDSLLHAVQYAVHASAITVSRNGAAVSIPYDREVQELMKKRAMQ